ncbi:dickkopf-related protein 3-like [Anneissia japonica]|uniref:dickkopf-related protein 3-like n=1 Tax=Anneissia japonica TaxID=1529436 RepID=UPI001425A7FD|nr:dickkopf-related protein 3-like [Anneissia japonica]
MHALQSCLTVLAFTVLVQESTGVIFPWMWSLPYPNQDQQSDEAISHPRNLNLNKRNVSSSADFNFTLVAQTPCRSDKACGRGKYCDQHYRNCRDHKVENAPCRQDSHCRKGLDCRFGKCQKTVKPGTVGARCKNSKDCGNNMCCAKQHGESICKLKLKLKSKCFVPEGGVEYTIDSICPCEDGLVCKIAHPSREEEFAWRFWTDYDHMRCQRI